MVEIIVVLFGLDEDEVEGGGGRGAIRCLVRSPPLRGCCDWDCTNGTALAVSKGARRTGRCSGVVARGQPPPPIPAVSLAHMNIELSVELLVVVVFISVDSSSNDWLVCRSVADTVLHGGFFSRVMVVCVYVRLWPRWGGGA